MNRAFRLPAALVCCLAACQPQGRRLLLLDLALSDPMVLEATAAPWRDAGYTVEYRRFYPHLTWADLARYRALVLLGGREPEAASDALALGDLALLTEWARRGGVVVLGYAGDGEGFLDRWTMNRWLAAHGTGIVIGDYALQDTTGTEPAPRARPLPQSALDNAGFEPFAASRNHVLLVARPSQALARTTATAFIRPPRDSLAPRPRAAVVAASRLGEGLVVVASRHLLAATGADVRPSTIPAALSAGDFGRTRQFLDALARWSRRPAEWADVAPAARGASLSLTGAPRPIAVHAPPLAPPPGAEATVLTSSHSASTTSAPSWIRRQGMRGLWSRASQRSLDSALAIVDAGALNVVATLVPPAALADTLAQRGPWRAIADRLRATSLRWFPAIALDDLRRQANLAAATRELDVRGDTAAVWCGLDSLLWSAALRPAYRALARLGGGERGGGGARSDVVSGVALDLDAPRGGYAGTGFCDATYRAGLPALGIDSADADQLAVLPPAERYDGLRERGLLARYYDGLERLVADRAAEIRRELQRTNPDLRFAFHAGPAPADWFSLGLMRGFSTPDAPVLVWTRERHMRDLLASYRGREIFALSAVGLAPDGVAGAEWPRLRRLAFVEHSGFWLPAPASDSVGRLIRRLAK